MAEIETLRQDWRTLYSKTLPKLAKDRNHAQSKWPVTLDHCFARIILDNTVGQGSQQWDTVIKKPAVKHMTAAQLKDAIELGQKIQDGKMDLQELDQISLMCRGKNEGKYGGPKHTANNNSKMRMPLKRKSVSEEAPTPKRQKDDKNQSTLTFKPSCQPEEVPQHPSRALSNPSLSDKSLIVSPEMQGTLQRVRSHQPLTPYRRRLYTILLSVPRGRYTTYAAMSDYLNSSARAVGSGMRNNPFAPDVPCHRVLAADGSIGGFCGDWGREGKHANKKLELLRDEGVKFDGKGKVVGDPFRKFHEFQGS